MNLVKQFMTLFLILFLGNLVAHVLKIPIPGSILGMLLLTIALITKIVKVEDVEDASKLLLDHLPIFILPSSVGIILYFDLIKTQLVGILVPTILSIIIGLYVTGKVVDFFVKKDGGHIDA